MHDDSTTNNGASLQNQTPGAELVARGPAVQVQVSRTLY